MMESVVEIEVRGQVCSEKKIEIEIESSRSMII